VGRRIAVSSTIRHVPSGQNSGLLRVVELDSGHIRLTAPIPQSAHRKADPNPRGGLRGGRGLSFLDERFVLANTERLFVFDLSWRMECELTHPLTAGIHDILAEADGIWITCTSCDVLLKLGWDGEVRDSWLWRRDRGLAAEFGFRSLPGLERGLDYRNPKHHEQAVHDVGHLNGVARGREGLVVSLGRVLSPAAYRSRRVERRLLGAGEASVVGRRAVRALKRRKLRSIAADPLPMPDRGSGSSALVLVDDCGRLAEAPPAKVLLRRDGLSFPNHDVIEVGAFLFYNDSNRGRLVAVDRDGRGGERSVPVPGDPGYARGLAWLEDETFLVGSQRPTAVHVIDLRAGRVESSIELSQDPLESVFSIAMVPDRFDDPPERLRFAPYRESI
jgi:hypothetical protein